MRRDRPPGRDEGGLRTVSLIPGDRLRMPTSPPPSAEVASSLSRRADSGLDGAESPAAGLSPPAACQWRGRGAVDSSGKQTVYGAP
jgi:hypothetical protein